MKIYSLMLMMSCALINITLAHAIPPSHMPDTAQQQNLNGAPLFAYVVKDYPVKKDGEIIEFRYKIKSTKTNLAHHFIGINLEKDGQEGGIGTFCGVIRIVVQYKEKAYIVHMYLREKNVFCIKLAKKLPNGDYKLIGDKSREDIILPELYTKLEYLFLEDKSFENVIKNLKEAESRKGEPYAL